MAIDVRSRLMQRRNGIVVGALAGVVAGMIALSFAAVPLYRIFCEATGFGGTTQRAAQASKQTLDRTIEVRFNADVNHELPWVFHPNQRGLKLKIGETGVTSFNARNESGEPVVGTAVYNVTPEKAGKYFVKIECFCFSLQALQPQESADLPVAFYIDPAIAGDRNLDDVTVITLSYTFYKAQSQALDKAVDDAGRAAEIEEINKATGSSVAEPAAKSPKGAVSGAAALAVGARVE